MWTSLFPGQGSQHPGMGKFLRDEFSVAKQTFEEASDALHLDLKKLCFEGSESDLALTENTQPCLLLVSTATHRVLVKEFGYNPVNAAGHSVGEYAAVVAAGALSFTDAMKAVRRRGQAMQSAVPYGLGGMSAVMGLEPKQVFDLCAWAEKETGDGPVQPANLNAPGQIVISGKKTVLDWLSVNFKAEAIGIEGRVRFIALKVSAPFHCSMMKPAEEKMAEVLGEMKFLEAKFPVVQNVSAEPVTDGAILRENLIKQVSAPVRWIESVQRITSLGATQAAEVGCGRVISGLVKKIDGEKLPVFNLNSLEDIKTFETKFKSGV
jgi:[acyl-carrier-protein] S-malonyltransferase